MKKNCWLTLRQSKIYVTNCAKDESLFLFFSFFLQRKLFTANDQDTAVVRDEEEGYHSASVSMNQLHMPEERWLSLSLCLSLSR